MRKVLLLIAAAIVLSGCMSTLQGVYDERRQEECEQESRGADRAQC